jgi:hypothetical protein
MKDMFDEDMWNDAVYTTFYDYTLDQDQEIWDFTHIDYQAGYFDKLFPAITINRGGDCNFIMSNLFALKIQED